LLSGNKLSQIAVVSDGDRMLASLRREISIDIGLQPPRNSPPQEVLLVATRWFAKQLLILGAQPRHRPLPAFLDLLKNGRVTFSLPFWRRA
jgi:hypothetical protein